MIHLKIRMWFLGLIAVLASLFGGCTPAPLVKNYTTPEETFRTWKEAAKRLDLQAIVSCYSRPAQLQLEKEIQSTSTEELSAMQKETKLTKFSIEKIVFEQNRAFLRVSRQRNFQSEIEVVNLIKEPEGWKLLPQGNPNTRVFFLLKNHIQLRLISFFVKKFSEYGDSTL